MRSTTPLFVVLGAAALAMAAGLAPACAMRGTATPNLDGGGGEGGGEGGTMGDGGCTPPAPPTPPVLGVSVFGDKCSSGAPAVAWSPLRRISRLEYDNMVHDLVGDSTQPATNFVDESPMATGVNLQTNTYGGVSALIAEQYLLAAEALGEAAVVTAAAGDAGGGGASQLSTVYSLNGIPACATQDATCAEAFIATFANRAFRGHLDATESTALLGIYNNIAGAPNNLGFTIGIQAVITAVLSSPWFLYVMELGDGTEPTGSAMALSQYEIAARLAFFLWRTVPDVGPGSLMEAAASSALSTPAQIQAQAVRMLADPRASNAINDFATQWLEILAPPSGKDAIFTAWNNSPVPGLGPEMKDETLTNYSQVVLGNGSLTTLLTSPSSYINTDLAAFYKVSLGSTPAVTVADPTLTGSQTQFVQTALPNRAGILTNASILAIQSHALLPSSVLRGKMIREDVLCDPIQPPPPNVPALGTSVPDGGTTRQLFQAHAQIDGTTGTGVFCYGCHKYMDFIAFGLGHFDATGAYQASDQNGATSGPALDVTGQIFPAESGELNTPINGATDLATKLASSTQVKECFALQAFRYSLGRLESADDACSIDQFYDAFTGSGLNIQKLLVAIVGTTAFRYRSAIGSACQDVDAGSACP